MNNILTERNRFEKEIEDNKRILNDSNNQCQVKFLIICLKNYNIIDYLEF